MVSWVINEVKEDYKFIDLLKPENDAAVPFLLALEPGYRQFLATVATLGLQARQHRLEKPAMPSIGGVINADGMASIDFGSDISAFGEAQPADEGEAALQDILKERIGGDVNQFFDTLSLDGAGQSPFGSDISTAKVIDRTIGIAKLLLSRDDQDVG